ncbi:MAG: lectin-like protein [Myxococcales bacterium]|nr:lectin-like protein [Myxococcales bacterium]
MYDDDLLPDRDALVEGLAATVPPDAAALETVDAAAAGQPTRADTGDSDQDAGMASGPLASPSCGALQDDDAGVDEECDTSPPSVRHRYRFDGEGTAITDDVGDLDGRAFEVRLTGTGSLMLAGGNSGEYAQLPTGIFEGLSEATIEFWMTWDGSGEPGARAVSFGTAKPEPLETCEQRAVYSDGGWYAVCPETTNWSTARARCLAAGAELLGVGSAREQAFLETFDGLPAWLAANDRDVEGEWRWATRMGASAGRPFWLGGSDGRPVAGAYVHWRVDSPQPDDHENEDCGFVRADGRWADQDCDISLSVACEWRRHQGTETASAVWFSPAEGPAGLPTFGFQPSGPATIVQGDAPLLAGTQIHVVLVVEPEDGQILLYVGGHLVGSAASPGDLTTLRDADNWLGRSHITGSPTFAGALHDLRIHTRALTPDEVTISRAAGPAASGD